MDSERLLSVATGTVLSGRKIRVIKSSPFLLGLSVESGDDEHEPPCVRRLDRLIGGCGQKTDMYMHRQ